ncbi:MAG TPA: glycoside hydrolase family 97 N-terminal domain-containing protein, partial [Mucilaginibacter sp.]|nr:glycoside hydrolase family 97 N-terminal domain-containing protein [Mucilaginibacter sp.]
MRWLYTFFILYFKYLPIFPVSFNDPRMKLIYTFLLSLAVLHLAQAQDGKKLTTSMGRVRLEFMLDNEGRPNYSVYYGDQTVIKPSAMGFTLANDSAFDKHFDILGSETIAIDETWKPVWGEVSSIRDHYNQITVHLKQKNSPNRLMNIIFRVFEDGVGFRYEFPYQSNLKYFIISNELTSFGLAGDHKTFWIPGDYDSNEYMYTTSKISEIDNRKMVESSTSIAVRVAPDPKAVQTPLMMKSANGLYINIHEAALVGFPAMQLHVDNSTYNLTANLVPDAVGNKAYVHAPFKTPWRTIIVSDKAADILASKLVLNLNEPSKIKDTSWIKPMKFVGIWWQMQTGKGTWNYSKDADTMDSNGHLIPNGT